MSSEIPPVIRHHHFKKRNLLVVVLVLVVVGRQQEQYCTSTTLKTSESYHPTRHFNPARPSICSCWRLVFWPYYSFLLHRRRDAQDQVASTPQEICQTRRLLGGVDNVSLSLAETQSKRGTSLRSMLLPLTHRRYRNHQGNTQHVSTDSSGRTPRLRFLLLPRDFLLSVLQLF
jgi:hypothetical protein